MFAHSLSNDTPQESSKDFDLLALILTHTDTTIHVSSSPFAIDNIECGSADKPCAILSAKGSSTSTTTGMIVLSYSILHKELASTLTILAYAKILLFLPSPPRNRRWLLFNTDSTQALSDDDDEMIASFTAKQSFPVVYIDFGFSTGFSSLYSTFLAAYDSSQLLINESPLSFSEVMSAKGISHLLLSQTNFKVTFNRATIHNIPRSTTNTHQSRISLSSSSFTTNTVDEVAE